MEQQAEQTKKRGCFFYGCLSFSILSVVAILFAGTGLYFAYQNISTKLESLVDQEPVLLEAQTLSDEEFEALKLRIARFKEATSTGTPIEPLTVDAKDINSLILKDERLKDLRGHVLIEIVDQRIRARVSFPLRLLDRPEKYLNATASVRFVDGDNATELYLEELRVKDEPAPALLTTLIRQTDLLAEARKNPESRELIELLDRVQVKNGRIILYGKGAITS